MSDPVRLGEISSSTTSSLRKAKSLKKSRDHTHFGRHPVVPLPTPTLECAQICAHHHALRRSMSSDGDAEKPLIDRRLSQFVDSD